MKWLVRGLVLGVMLLLSAVFLGLTALAALHQQWLLMVVAGLVTVGVVPIGVRRGLQRLTLTLGLLCFIVFAQGILDGGAARLAAMAERVRSGGAAALRPEERVGVYVLGLAMAAGAAAAGYREIAREHLLLYQQGPAERPFAGDLPSEAPSVRAALREYVRKLSKDARDARNLARPRPLPETVVPVPYSAATMRLALALNPVRLSAQANKTAAGYVLDVTAKVDCRYDRRSRVPLFVAFGQTYSMDEAPFYALQEVGLLHPYTAVWHFSIREDDPRIN